MNRAQILQPPDRVEPVPRSDRVHLAASRRPLRVLLVYVGAPESPLAPVMSAPMGVQILGSLTRERFPRATVELADSRLQSLEEIAAVAADLAPDAIGISFLSVSTDDVVALLPRLRGSARLVVAGGVHASLDPGGLLAAGVDVVVQGEGEQAWLDVCATLCDGGSLPRYLRGSPWPDLDTLPLPGEFAVYAAYQAGRPYRSAYVEGGRGCPMRCTFCELPNRDIFAAYDRARVKSRERLLQEIQTHVDRGVGFITMTDSIATMHPRAFEGVVEAFAARFGDVGLMFNGHVRRFDRPLARTIGRAQARRRGTARISVWFGFESASPRMLRLLQKHTTPERARVVAGWCREEGVDVGANILIGLPGEDDRDHAANFAFLRDFPPAYPNPNILNPLPGTQMYDHCRREGLLRQPGTVRLWSRDDIAEHGEGPVRGVDYARVVAAYDAMRAERYGEGPGWLPWGESPTGADGRRPAASGATGRRGLVRGG